MCKNKTVLREVYESSFQQKMFANFDTLKEIALEQAPASLLNATLIKKQKKEKKTKDKEKTDKK
jgi:hypothetical protein